MLTASQHQWAEQEFKGKPDGVYGAPIEEVLSELAAHNRLTLYRYAVDIFDYVAKERAKGDDLRLSLLFLEGEDCAPFAE